MTGEIEMAAVVLAAGQSVRMGSPKLALPWGDTTVIGAVVRTFWASGIHEIVVVTGGARQATEAALRSLPARTVFNPRYRQDSMMLSLQTGLAALGPQVSAAFVALGDQPHLEGEVVQRLAETYRLTRSPLVVPSYQMRRGHPWVLDRSLWAEALQAPASRTLRHFLGAHADLIHHLPVDSESILKDLDTPDDYYQLSQA